MKRIVDGKRYDTEAAEMVTWVGSRSGISRSDNTYWDAGLYRTPSRAVVPRWVRWASLDICAVRWQWDYGWLWHHPHLVWRGPAIPGAGRGD